VKLNSDFNGVAQDYIKKYLRLLFVGFFQAQPQVEKLNVYSNESGRRVMNKVAWYHHYLMYCDISFHEMNAFDNLIWAYLNIKFPAL